MTKLFNKRHMLAELENYLRLARRQSSHCSLILLDIDHFKRFNDTYGHLTGDRVLIGVARILREGVRACDIPCRYGGEELAVILPEGTLAGTKRLAERLRKTIAETAFEGEKGEALQVTASFGVAEADEATNLPQELIERADAALYQSKEAGRNRVTVFRA
jgi:diguanylate cyclase (GGDEF)-like protein